MHFQILERITKWERSTLFSSVRMSLSSRSLSLSFLYIYSLFFLRFCLFSGKAKENERKWSVSSIQSVIMIVWFICHWWWIRFEHFVCVCRSWIYWTKMQTCTNWLVQYLWSRIWQRRMRMCARELNISRLNCMLLILYFVTNSCNICLFLYARRKFVFVELWILNI